MRRRVSRAVWLTFALLGCYKAPIAPQSPPGPPVPLPGEVAQACRFDLVSGPDGKANPWLATVTCPCPPALHARWAEIANIGFAPAAVWALYLERPVFMASPVRFGNEGFSATFAYPDDALLAAARQDPNAWRIVSAREVLPPDGLAYYLDLTAQWRENNAYDACNRLVLSPDAAMADAARAQACATTMAVIDGRRRQRAEDVYRRQQFADAERNRQWTYQLQQQQQAFDANENRKAAFRQLLQSQIRSSQGRSTTCTTMGNTTNCNTW